MEKRQRDNKATVSRSRPLICSAHGVYFNAERFKAVCPNCNGSGQTFNDRAIGQEMRRLRGTRNVSLRGIAAKLGFSAAYVSDLERGRRGWSETKIQTYINALGLT